MNQIQEFLISPKTCHLCKFALQQSKSLKKRDVMLRHIFRMYDIRGIVGTDFSIEEVYDLGRAIAVYYSEQNPHVSSIVIGVDGRIHSLAIKEQLCRAFIDSGFHVIFIGVCPTPVLYFTLHTRGFDAGIMITASHNGPDYNGFKICLGTSSVWGHALQSIWLLLQQKSYLIPLQPGSYREISVIDHYVTWLAEQFAHLKGFSMRTIIDCGNGTTGPVVKKLCAQLNFSRFDFLYADIDGTFPHHEADPTIAHNMNAVRERLHFENYTLGIGFDGDGDRMAPMTAEGLLVAGDKLLALLSKQLLAKNPKAAIVFDVKCSDILTTTIHSLGGIPIMAPSGYSHIKNVMKQHHALLGGELSCHFFFADRYFGFDDGIYAMLRLLELLQETGQSLSEHILTLPITYAIPELRLPCHEEHKSLIIQEMQRYFEQMPNCSVSLLDGIRIALPYGWGIVRASNTQPAICIRYESTTRDGLEKLKQNFFQALTPHFDHALIHQHLESLPERTL